MCFDAYGDVAQNDGQAGHQTRHFELLRVLFSVLRAAFGARLRKEPADCESYSSTHRPDLEKEGEWVGDCKARRPSSGKVSVDTDAGSALARSEPWPAHASRTGSATPKDMKPLA